MLYRLRRGTLIPKRNGRAFYFWARSKTSWSADVPFPRRARVRTRFGVIIVVVARYTTTARQAVGAGGNWRSSAGAVCVDDGDIVPSRCRFFYDHGPQRDPVVRRWGRRRGGYRDVAADASSRWQSSPPPPPSPYIAARAHHVPTRVPPRYCVLYCISLCYHSVVRAVDRQPIWIYCAPWDCRSFRRRVAFASRKPIE